MPVLPETEQICEILANTRRILIESVAQIPPVKFSWTPCPSAASVEAILRHIAEWETSYLSVIVHNDRRDTDRTLQAISGREPLLKKLEDTRAKTLRVIRQLRPTDLDSVRRYSDGERTVRHMLLRILRHEYYHTGQINYIYLLLNPEATGQAVPSPPL